MKYIISCFLLFLLLCGCGRLSKPSLLVEHNNLNQTALSNQLLKQKQGVVAVKMM